MNKLDEQNPDAVILDLALGEENGLDLLHQLLQQHPDLPVIMITGFGTIETAVNAIKLGAFDYLRKPVDFNRLLGLVKKALDIRTLKNENAVLKKRLSVLDQTAVFRSEVMQELYRKANALAAEKIPLLITGEPGTGKDLLASYIHKRSDAASQEPVRINCGSFGEEMLIRELLGFSEGDNHYAPGLLEQAAGNTLYLEEIDQAPLEVQKRLGRILKDGFFTRIDSQEKIELRFRLIASINGDPSRLVEGGELSPLLFTLLNSAQLHLLPLRNRREDIAPLVSYFCSREDLTGTDPEVMQILNDYHWPGNIRELKNLIAAASLQCSTGTLTRAELPPGLIRRFQVDTSDLPPLEAAEKRIIISTLKENSYNKKKTAELLNISRKTLYNKLERYDISQPDFS